MSEHDSFPGLTGHAADLLDASGHAALGERLRPASVYLTGQHTPDGDGVVLEWADTSGHATPEQVEHLLDALNAAAQTHTGWRFSSLHQRS